MKTDKNNEQGVVMDYLNENCTTGNCWAFSDEIKSSLHRIPLNEFLSICGGIPLYTDSEAVYIEEKDSHSLIVGSTGSKKNTALGHAGPANIRHSRRIIHSDRPKRGTVQKNI